MNRGKWSVLLAVFKLLNGKGLGCFFLVYCSDSVFSF